MSRAVAVPPIFNEHVHIENFLEDFVLEEKRDLILKDADLKTEINFRQSNGIEYPVYVNEFWTPRQRQGNALHEVAYRACFKPQLPRFFIELLSRPGDVVYDPFSGRGTTAVEAGLLGRNVIANDANPLSRILAKPRLNVPSLDEIERRLTSIKMDDRAKAELDLSMFYHPKTESEIVSLKQYLEMRSAAEAEDHVDEWIRMIATNRLTGHSPGFFSVYTLPPNQAVSPQSQIKINFKRNQSPEYRDTKKLIRQKFVSLTSEINETLRERLKRISRDAKFLSEDARRTTKIPRESVDLTVTSPPFLDVVQYADDNWLRGWFNGINFEEVEKKITVSKTIGDWRGIMQDVLLELRRITKAGGWIAFEVGEIRNGSINLDEHVAGLGLKAGLECAGVVVNSQAFTKTSNIWGIKNNSSGTNTNRIVLFQKK